MSPTLPTPLVTTSWLANHLDDPDLRILDATYMLSSLKRDAAAEYEDGHIPGAIFFDIDKIAQDDTDLPHMVPSPERFAELVGNLGIGSGHRIVAYDTFGLFSAARAWWLFRLYGHDAVAVLDGGLKKWRQEGRPIDQGAVVATKAAFGPQFRPGLLRSVEQDPTDRHGRHGTGDGRAQPRPLCRRGAGAATGRPARPYPGRRQSALCRPDRSQTPAKYIRLRPSRRSLAKAGIAERHAGRRQLRQRGHRLHPGLGGLSRSGAPHSGL